MKMLKKVLVLLIVIAPLLAVPKQSKAGVIGDIITALFGSDDKEKDKKTGSRLGKRCSFQWWTGYPGRCRCRIGCLDAL